VPLIAFFAALLVVFVFVLSTPFLLIVRYRLGTARRPARRWIATINLLSFLSSAALFLWIAAMTNFWVPRAFGYSLVGFAVGALLGLFWTKVNAMGTDKSRFLLHAEPLACPFRHARGCRSFALRFLANLARLAHNGSRQILARRRRHSWINGRRRSGPRLLPHLLRRRPLAVASEEARESTRMSANVLLSAL
jgi:hypothetical protein